MRPVAILAEGMITGVGLNAGSSCAAIRCAISNFSETRFMDKGGEWIIGSQVPLEKPWRGVTRHVRMVVPAIRECLDQVERERNDRIPLLLCVAEEDRPGRLEGLDDQLLSDVQTELGVHFHPYSSVIARGRVAGAMAMERAAKLIYEGQLRFCIIAGVDSFLVASTLASYEGRNRLLTSQNSDGFVPGEAGAAVLIGSPERMSGLEMLCLGIGKGREKATIDSEEPLRGDGLAQALRAALVDAGTTFAAIDFRVTDSNGEQYYFKEAALGFSRACRERKEQFEIWHPADCIGETGAAAGPLALAVAQAAVRKHYTVGPRVLCHFGSDDGERVALILTAGGGKPH